jgi:hypothetical protein
MEKGAGKWKKGDHRPKVLIFTALSGSLFLLAFTLFFPPFPVSFVP